MRGGGSETNLAFNSVHFCIWPKKIPTPSPFFRRGSAGLVQLMEVPITKFPDMIHANDEEGGDGGETFWRH